MFFMVLQCQYHGLRYHNRCLFAILLVWGLIFGLRAYDVGNDTPMYVSFFSGETISGLGSYDIDNDTTEYGFTIVVNFISRITNNPTFFLSIMSITAFVLLYPFYKDKKMGLWSLLCFILMSSSFSAYIIALRQSMSIIFILLGIHLFEKIKGDATLCFDNTQCHIKVNKVSQRIGLIKSKFKSVNSILGLSLCLFSIYIHRTTVLLLPILLFCYIFRFNKKNAYIVVCLVFFVSQIFQNIIGDYFDIVLSFVGGVDNENVNLLADRYADNFASSSMTLLKYLSWCVPMLLTVRFTPEERIYSFQFACLMFGFSAYMLLGSATMCIRISMLFQLIGFSCFIPELVEKKTNLKYIYILFTLLYFYSAYQSYVRWIAAPYDSTLPFYFIWEQH